MKIDNFRVYDLAESIVASGLPMQEEYRGEEFVKRVYNGGFATDYQRARKLANNPAGSGHNNFLSGCLAACNVTATIKWWHQLERYHFVQIVSSQSTMHRLLAMMDNGTARLIRVPTPRQSIDSRGLLLTLMMRASSTPVRLDWS